jgi:hypothetical protein
MIHDECSKISIENKKFYYDLHREKIKKCSTLVVVTVGCMNRDPRSDYFHLDSLLWILQASFEFELRREYTEHYLCKKVQPQML